MTEQIMELFLTYKEYALLISIIANIVIALFAVIPSVFITAANVTFFGFWQGMWISFIGEALGAVIAFVLYRKGFKTLTNDRSKKHPKIRKLLTAQGKDAFILILWLRLMPFIPSGLVTFIAAVGEVSLVVYVIASSLGKLPALLIEVYSVYEIINFTFVGKILMGVLLFSFMIIYVYRRKQRS
jgi:uncharacterized membrane protein YdjX (TVP38/TMEM64 family)